MRIFAPKVLFSASRNNLFKPLTHLITRRLTSNHRASTDNPMQQLNPSPSLRRSYQVVVAATCDMGIEKDGKLRWSFPSGLKFFKELTSATTDPRKKNAVVIGRKTWESIPFKYRTLTGRLNVVLSSSGNCPGAGNLEKVVVCRSIPSALELLAAEPLCSDVERVFFIGGGQILRETLNGDGCKAIHITEIGTSIECDTFIRAIDHFAFQQWYSSPLVMVEFGIVL